MTNRCALAALVWAALLFVPLAAAQSVDPAASAADGAVLRDCGDCPELVVIPGGAFVMGTSEDLGNGVWRDDDEGPPVSVRVSRFLIGRMEVSDVEVGRCIAAGQCPRFAEYGDNVTWMDEARLYDIPSPRPVQPDWELIQEYLRWLSERTGRLYRLPSEAEWEYAARAGATTKYFWGDNEAGACAYANVEDLTFRRSINLVYSSEETARLGAPYSDCDDGNLSYGQVGQYRPNAFGLYDMIGNVQEVVADCYHPSHANTPTDGSPYDERGCERRVTKGGNAHNPFSCGMTGDPSDTRLTARAPADVGPRYQTGLNDQDVEVRFRATSCFGFRVARSIN